jgi:hypothetical protein
MQVIAKTRIKAMLERVKKSPSPTTFVIVLSPEALSVLDALWFWIVSLLTDRRFVMVEMPSPVGLDSGR